MSQIFIHFLFYYFHIVPFSSIPNLFWYMIYYIKFKLIPFPKVFSWHCSLKDSLSHGSVRISSYMRFLYRLLSFPKLPFLFHLFLQQYSIILMSLPILNDRRLVFTDLILMKYSSFKTFYCSCSIIPGNYLRIIFQIIINPLGFWLAVCM